MKQPLRGKRRLIPTRARLERDLPVESLIPLAIREGNRKRPIYEIHKWWARRLGSNFRMLLLAALLPSSISNRQLWRAFYSPHRRRRLVVLDPFMGGGTTIVEASKLGARVIGNDIDPVAWFVTKKELEPCDEVRLREEFARLEQSVAGSLRAYYKHKLPDGESVDVINFFWVMAFDCTDCGRRIEAHPHYVLHHDTGGRRRTVFCCRCGAVAELSDRRRVLRCGECGQETDVRLGPVANGRYTCPCGSDGAVVDVAKPGKPIATRLFALEYETTGGERVFARATEDDRALYEAARRELHDGRSTLSFPKARIPAEGRFDDRPLIYGFAQYQQLFNARQLLCLARLRRAIRAVADAELREYLLLAFSDSLGSNNMLCSYAFAYRKLSPLFGMHAYRVVTRPVEGNVWGCRYGRGSFSKCFEKLLRGKAYCRQPYEVIGKQRARQYTGESLGASTTVEPKEWHRGDARALLMNGDSQDLRGVRDGCVDLILTDPPYYNNLPYSELSDFYYVWLRNELPDSGHRWGGFHTPYKDSLLVRRQNLSEHRRFARGMAGVLKECRRVLRPDGLLVLTYHHSDWRAWIVLGEALAGADLRITNVLPLLAEGRSGFHSDDGNIKWDAVIVCRPARSAQKRARLLSEDDVVKFADQKCGEWRRRLAHVDRRPNTADMASLAYAFGIWALLMSDSTMTVEEAVHAVSLRVNGDRRPYGLFRPPTEASAGRRTAAGRG